MSCVILWLFTWHVSFFVLGVCILDVYYTERWYVQYGHKIYFYTSPPSGLYDLCQYGRTATNIEELKNIYYTTPRYLKIGIYVKKLNHFKYF
jgi:hypothetical protein